MKLHPRLQDLETNQWHRTWILEVHNPTDTPITTRIRANPAFDPLKTKAFPTERVTIPAGGSLIETR